MHVSQAIYSTARHLLEEEWSEAARNTPAPNRFREGCPLLWCLPELMETVFEHPDRPVHDVAPAIRRFVIEHSVVDENGDGMIETRELSNLERQVQMVLRVLERVRIAALEEGLWSDAPVTPVMFG